MTNLRGTALDRYSGYEYLADLWLTKEGAGKFFSIHEVEKALAKVQARMGLIPQEASVAIDASTFDLERIINMRGHDMNAYLTVTRESIPPEYQGFLHRGATTYDGQDSGLSLMYINSATFLISHLQELYEILIEVARQHKDTLMVGRSHMQHGKPITFAFKILNWAWFVKRAIARLEWAKEAIAYGKISGAMGIYTLDPEIEEKVCDLLGLKPALVSTQILPRDMHADYFHAITCAAAACEFIATEIRHLQRTEVYEVVEPFPPGMKGSSAMPHKRNPEACEMVCGICRVVRNEMGSIYENIITMHERSIEQSSVERLVHSEMIVLVGHAVKTMNWVIGGLEVNTDRMLANLDLTHGAIYSEEVKILLLDKGLDPEKVYYAIQDAGQRAFNGDGDMKSNLLAHPEIGSELTEKELDAVMDPWYEVRFRDHIYRRFGI